MPKKKTRYSEVFEILLNNSAEKRKGVIFDLIFGWIESDISDASISQFNTGRRHLSDNFVSPFLLPNGIKKSKEYIADNFTNKISDKKSLISELINWLDENKIHEATVNQLKKISSENISLFITYILYLAATDSNEIADLSTLDEISQSELISEEEQELFRKRIWDASKDDYYISHRIGNRFANLNIIETLLPKGYIESDFMDFHFRSNDPELKSIDDICNSTKKNIAITGEGGIGKTTFLQKILERIYGTEDNPTEYDSDSITPIFIELNKCPKTIDKWIDPLTGKSNFITRYIADSIQSSGPKYRDYNKLLNLIESEFDHHSNMSKKKYLLLLDGYNEVSMSTATNGESIRAILSNEISKLKEYNNVRILTTSRVTQSAYYTTGFTPVYLTGLEPKDVQKHLINCNYKPEFVGQILSNKNIMKCLKIPLFLCMFSIKNDYSDSVIPETYGEILSNFFHKNGNFYNIRKRFKEVGNNPFDEKLFATELVLDFIVPYIGWYMVHNDIFSLSKMQLTKCIEDAVNETSTMLDYLNYLPLTDFKNDIHLARTAIRNYDLTDHQFINSVIDCIHGYLGIMYEYDNQDDNNQILKIYSFIHHHFRDYFSAMWNVNTLRLLPYFNSSYLRYFTPQNIFSYHWNTSEAESIGQILQEHRNKPLFNPNTQNWELPEPSGEDQKLLTSILDWIRNTKSTESKTILIKNLINTFNSCRGELSGLFFDKLDLEQTIFHNMTCSKKGKSETLAASFRMSKLSEASLEPVDHLDMVSECFYAGNMCITMDQDNLIKIWDVISGNQITYFKINQEYEYPDYDSVNFMRITKDNKYLAVKKHYSEQINQNPYILIFQTDNNNQDPSKIELPNGYKKIDDFIFSDNNSKLIVLADEKTLFIFNRTKNDKYNKINYILKEQKPIKNLYNNCRLFISEANIYIFSYELNLADAEYSQMIYSNEDDNYDDWDDNENYDDEDNLNITKDDLVSCSITKLSMKSKKELTIHNYKSAPFTRPSFAYIASCDSFLYYNEENKHLELFDCEFEDSTPILHEIIKDNEQEMPSTIHYTDNHKKSCYIMYPDVCYKAEINKTGISHIIEKYNVPDLHSDFDDLPASELTFLINTAPSNNRFMLINEDGETYEWNIENGAPIYKYNTRIFDTVALFKDSKRDLFMLIHEQNGVSIFSQSTCKLVNSYCFGDKGDYRIGNAVYSEETGLLFLLFERGSHNYLIYINVTNSYSDTIYSDKKPTDQTTRLCMSDDGMKLLFTDSFNCYEYSIKSNTYTIIATAKENEMYTYAYYANNDVHIGIAMARTYLEPTFRPRCEIYTKDSSNKYECHTGYYIPTLDKELIKDFIHEYCDTGIPCEFRPDFEQSYWITRGFFINATNEINAFLQLKSFKVNDGKIIDNGYISIQNFQMLQVIHDFALENKNIINGTYNAYSYLSKDYSEAMFIYDCDLVTHWKNLKERPDKFTQYNYRSTPELAIDGTANWGFALPISNNKYICCADSYRLFIVDAKDGRFIKEIEYSPGLCIVNCKFKNTIMDSESKTIVEQNGGIL